LPNIRSPGPGEAHRSTEENAAHQLQTTQLNGKIIELQEQTMQSNIEIKKLKEEHQEQRTKSDVEIKQLNDEAKNAIAEHQKLQDETKEIKLKLDISLAATRRIRLLEFLENYPKPRSGLLRKYWKESCTWKHNSSWGEGLLFAADCNDDYLPSFIPVHTVSLAFRAQFGISV
jgi:hypothetical protein